MAKKKKIISRYRAKKNLGYTRGPEGGGNGHGGGWGLGGGGGQSVAPLQNPGSAPRDDPLMGSKASGTAAGGFGVNNNIFISKNYVLLGGWVWVCGCVGGCG